MRHLCARNRYAFPKEVTPMPSRHIPHGVLVDATNPMRDVYAQINANQEQDARERTAARAEPRPAIAPADEQQRTQNPLRPQRLADVVGQAQAKHLISAALRRSRARREPLPHMLLVGPAGTGKSTLSHVVANELGSRVYQLAAPVSHDVLLELREIMHDRDVLFVDEIHLQAIQERRGRESITRPEVLFGILEDRVIPTQTGVLPFPAITMIGGTTDEGMLSDAFMSRFPLRPRMTEYTREELGEIAARNARTLGATLTPEAAGLFATASRGVPREVNNLIKNAVFFSRRVTERVAREVLSVNGIEATDGLTPDMAAMLKFMLRAGRRPMADGTVRYQCSVSTIATGIGKSRDTKSVVLRIEPWLIHLGYLSVAPGGRMLTELGIERAEELAHPKAPTPVASKDEPTPAARALEHLMKGGN